MLLGSRTVEIPPFNSMIYFGEQDKIKIIHIAGTNGKGTVANYIACSLEANGFKDYEKIKAFIERVRNE